MTATHAIHALQFDLAIEGVAETIARDNSYYVDWVRDLLLPIIGEVIEQEAAEAGFDQHRHHRIAKLELDLGEIEVDTSDHEIERRLRSGLHAALKEHLPRGEVHSTNTVDSISRSPNDRQGAGTYQTTEHEQHTHALQAFLRTGTLEWAYAQNPRYAHKRLLQKSLVQRHNQALLQEILSQPLHLLRLIRQFDTADLMQIAQLRFATWSTNERNRVLDWLSFELSQHSLNRDYCENLWLFVLHGAWQAKKEQGPSVQREPQDSIQLVSQFYASLDLDLTRPAQQARAELVRLAQALGVRPEALDSLKQLFMQLTSEEHQDVSRRNIAKLSPALELRSSSLPLPTGAVTQPTLDAMLLMLTQADYANLEANWPELLRNASQHLEDLHAKHAQIWRDQLPLPAKRDLVDLFHAEVIWLLDALSSLLKDAKESKVYAETVDYMLCQAPHSLTVEALLQALEARFHQELKQWTPQARQLDVLMALPMEQSYQHALSRLQVPSQATESASNLNEFSRYWSDSQWQKWLSKYDTAQLRNLVKASYESRGVSAELTLVLIDSAQTSGAATASTVALQTLWSLIRAAMDIRYRLSSQNLADEVAMVLLQMNARQFAHSGAASQSEAELLAQVLADLRHKQVLSITEVSSKGDAIGQRRNRLAAALTAWLESSGNQKWRSAIEALMQGSLSEHRDTESSIAQASKNSVTTPINGTWLLQENLAQAEWLALLFDHPQDAIQAYKSWDQTRRLQVIAALKPELRPYLALALHAPHARLIKELANQLESLHDLIMRASGSDPQGHTDASQLHQEVQQGLLGLSKHSPSIRLFDLSLSTNKEQARAAIVGIFIEQLAQFSGHTGAQWHTALTQSLLGRGAFEIGTADVPQTKPRLTLATQHALSDGLERMPIFNGILVSTASQLQPIETVETATQLAEPVGQTASRMKFSDSVDALWQTLLRADSSVASPFQTLPDHARGKLLQLYRLIKDYNLPFQRELQALFETILVTMQTQRQLARSSSLTKPVPDSGRDLDDNLDDNLDDKSGSHHTNETLTNEFNRMSPEAVMQKLWQVIKDLGSPDTVSFQDLADADLAALSQLQQLITSDVASFYQGVDKLLRNQIVMNLGTHTVVEPDRQPLLSGDASQILFSDKTDELNQITDQDGSKPKYLSSEQSLLVLWQAIQHSETDIRSQQSSLATEASQNTIQLQQRLSQSATGLQKELRNMLASLSLSTNATSVLVDSNKELSRSIEALLWRTKQSLGIKIGEAFSQDTAMGSEEVSSRWQHMSLDELQQLGVFIEGISLDESSLLGAEQALIATQDLVEHRAAREIATLLDLGVEVSKERLLAGLIQTSSTHSPLAPMSYYQRLLNRWFQTLGQAEAALPFLRCVEFYATQLQTTAAQAYFLKSVLRELLGQRDIDIELLLEQAREHFPGLQVSEGTNANTLFARASETQTAPSQPDSEDLSIGQFHGFDTVGLHRLPSAISQLQSIISTPAKEQLQAAALTQAFPWIRRPALRVWLLHYFCETILRALVPTNAPQSNRSKQLFSFWRPQVRRSIAQAQDYHLLFLLGAALSTTQAEPHAQLIDTLCDEFSLQRKELEKLTAFCDTLSQDTWLPFLGTRTDQQIHLQADQTNAPSTSTGSIKELGQQLFVGTLPSTSGQQAEQSITPVPTAHSQASPLPRSWQDHLPQILAEAMLSGVLTKLDTVWPELLQHHAADLVRAQTQYVRSTAQRSALMAQNSTEKIRDLMAVNRPQLAQLSSAIDFHAEQLHALWHLAIPLPEWRAHLLQHAYQVSLSKDLVKQTPAQQLVYLLRTHPVWPTQAHAEQSLLAQAAYALLPATKEKNDLLIEALTESLADFERRQTLALDEPHVEGNEKLLEESQSLIDDDTLYQDLLEHLQHDVAIASTLQALGQSTRTSALSSISRSLSERLWSSSVVYRDRTLWKKLAQELRAQSRSLHPEEGKDTGVKFDMVDLALAKLIDSQIIHDLGLGASTETRISDITSEASGKDDEPFEQSKLVVLLQSLSALNHNETQWARTVVRRLLMQQASPHESHLSQASIDRLKDTLSSDLILDRWCELLDPVELEQFFALHHNTIAAQLRRLLPLAAIHLPNMLDADGRWWNKKALRAFYQLGFTRHSSKLEEYLAAVGLLAHARASQEDKGLNLPQSTLVAQHFEELKTELKRQEAIRLEQERRHQEQRRRAADELKKRARLLGEEEELPYGESNIHNAGMVIIAPYIQRLFSILELTKNNAFVDDNAAQRAVHLLQYVVSGETSTPEYQLSLNKLLCGIHGGVPIVAGIDLSEHEKNVVEQMLNGIISHWSALGKTSIAGLRQTFLIREGQLTYDEESWHLRIPSSTFDMLLDRLPWSFSMIKLPWMRAPLHVKWRANS